METKLSSLQLYSLMLAFLLGTSIIYGAPRLVPDTWLVNLVAIVPALLLTGFYLLLIMAGRGQDLYGMFLQAWGGLIGRLFILVYVVYFLYIASRNIRDMLELILTALLRNTPSQILVVLFLLIIGYAAAGETVSLGRLSILITGMILFFFLALTLLLFFSGSIHGELLRPFLSEGFGAVAFSALRSTVWFPYGELIVLLTLGSALGQLKPLRKVGFVAILSAVVILTFSDLLQTSTLGLEYKKYSVFALLDAARLINLANFITRMDALVAIIFIFSVLLKSAIFLHAGAKGAACLFGSEFSKYVYPLAWLIGGLSLLIARNGAEHVTEGLVYVIYWLHIPLQFVVPLATWILLRIRNPHKVAA